MGVIAGFGAHDLGFTSRALVRFRLSGTTDGGLQFGVTFTTPDAGTANRGSAGSVFIAGSYGKLTMGDVAGAAKASMGQVSGISLTGLKDANTVVYIGEGNGAATTNTASALLYQINDGDLALAVSVTNPGNTPVARGFAVGARYTLGDHTLALGYETVKVNGTSDVLHQIIVGAAARFGKMTVKTIYGVADLADLGGARTSADDQWATSVDYRVDALTVSAFYTDKRNVGGAQTYGLGGSLGLGGGATLKGGYAKDQTTDQRSFDFGISMNF
jgi:outer membrane protein OmpU